MTKETILRGTKIRIYPNKRQTGLMDLWRRRTISLWNLLLSLEQAAYSGENTRSRLRWRSIWADVLQESYESNLNAWAEGKKVRMGKNKGQIIPPKTGPAPEPPAAEALAKIQRQAVETDPETGEVLPPKLFIWEHELHKIMARLKRVPRTHWVADLPSHAAQAVVKDLIKALQAMLRERKKRASGAGGRDTGFPKFKKSRYAAGSVYFANTQLKFDFEKNRVQFPNGCGWMVCELTDQIRFAPKAKLMGGRIWRQGEEWFLSCQWEIPKPDPLPETGRIAGVKIGVSVLLTTYDERGQTREYQMPPADPKLIAKHKLAGKKLSRVLVAQKQREKKKASSGYAERRAARLASRDAKSRPLRLRRSKAFFEGSARLAKLEAAQRDARDDFLHKLTTGVARTFDVIAVQKMNVADLMRKPSRRHERRLRRKREGSDQKPRDLKPVRKLMRHVAMARCVQQLQYKMTDLRGPHAFQQIDKFDVNVSACSSCGTIHPDWKDGRKIVRCDAELPDGSRCNSVLPRNRNAARLTRRELEKRKEKAEQD